MRVPFSMNFNYFKIFSTGQGKNFKNSIDACNVLLKKYEYFLNKKWVGTELEAGYKKK
jgi:hypothetical protein